MKKNINWREEENKKMKEKMVSGKTLHEGREKEGGRG